MRENLESGKPSLPKVRQTRPFSSIYEYLEMRSPLTHYQGSCFVVVDAGGGTVVSAFLSSHA